MDAQQLLKSAFSTFGDLAPDAMAALAERFFTHPRRIPAPPRERPWIDERGVHPLPWRRDHPRCG